MRSTDMEAQEPRLEMDRRAGTEDSDPLSALERMAILADVGLLVDEALDFERTLERLAELLVPRLADYCVIDLLEGDEIRRVGTAHADPAQRGLIAELGAYEPDLSYPSAVTAVLRSGEPLLMPEVDFRQFHGAHANNRHEHILRQLDPRSSILIPLQVRGQTIGLLTVALTGHGLGAARRYGATELELLIKLGHRAAIVLDHIRLVQSERQAVDRISRLQWLVMILSQANTTGEVAEIALHECSHALSATAAVLQLLDPDKEHLDLVGAFGIPDVRLAPWRRQPIRSNPAATPIAEAVHTRKPIFIETHEEWSRRYPTAIAAPLGPVGASMAIPLIVEGRVVGGMGFSFDGNRRFDDDARTFAIALAEQCTLAFERARLFDAEREARLAEATARHDAEETAGRAARLLRLTEALSRAVTREDAAHILVAEGRAAIGADGGCVWLLSGNGTTLELVAQAGYREAMLGRLRHLRLADPLPVCESIRRGEPVLLAYAAEPGLLAPSADGGMDSGFHYWLAIPLEVRGQALGGLAFSFSERHALSDDDRSWLQAMTRHAAQVMERARLFDALRESEERLRVALSAAEMGTWRWDLRAGRDTRDAGLNRLLGLPAAETTQPVEDFFDHIHPDDQARVQVELEEAIAGRGAYQSDLRVLRRDGSTRWMRNRGMVLCDDAGRPVTMTGVLVDLTSQRRTDARFQFLAEASTALASSLDYERTLKTLARLAVPLFADWCTVDIVADDGTLHRLATHHGEPVKVSLALEIMRRYPPEPQDTYGLTAVAHTGEPEWRPEILDEQLAAVAVDAEHLRLLRELGMRSYILVPLKLRERILGVLAFIRSETEDRYTADDLQLAQEIAGRAAVAVENARLYTALSASEQEAKHAYEVAKRAERRKDEFLAVLGHELRNPLAPIATALELMKMKGDEPTRRERDIIERQVDHLTRLVDDLLDISRITRGLIELRKEPVELGAIIAKAIEMASPLLERRRQHLTVAVPAEGLRAEIDPVRIAQVVANLLNNAAKYTNLGGHIAVSAKREGQGQGQGQGQGVTGELVIRVRDDGRGMSAELLPTVFDLFVQGERIHDRSVGGLGIGLTLVRSIVELHGGRVGAYSEGQGQGSEFVVWLPDTLHVTEVQRQAHTAEAPRPDRRGTREETARRVLVVDDNLDAADTLAEILRLCGYQVAVAHDGPSALEIAPDLRPHFALLDIGLPVMDGYELGRRLLQLPGFEGLRLIAITGYDQERDRAQSLAAGFHEHLVKPVDISALLELLRTLDPVPAAATDRH